MNEVVSASTTPPDSRRYVATGVPNIQRLLRHEGDTKGPLYFLVKRQGKRIRRSLETADIGEARKRAKVLLDMIRAEKWNDLQGARARGGWSTLPEIYARYEETAKIKTAKRAVKMMKHLLKLAGKDPAGSSSQLDSNTVWAFQQALLKAAGDDQLQRVRSIVSANSILRQARSLFAAVVMPGYAGMTLPDLHGFLKAPKMQGGKVQYVEPPAQVIAQIAADYPALKASDPGAYAVFLLGTFVGLRNNEAKVAEWAWVEEDGAGKTWLRLATRPHWKSKTSRGRDVEIPAGVLAELRAVRETTVEGVPAEAAYLVPAHHMTERGTRVFKRLNAWLRARGLDERSFPKGYYELRKHFMNRQTWEHGTYRAARRGGNSPKVVEQFYSDAGGRAPLEIPAPAAS